MSKSHPENLIERQAYEFTFQDGDLLVSAAYTFVEITVTMPQGIALVLKHKEVKSPFVLPWRAVRDVRAMP